jgi:hypothetical protein
MNINLAAPLARTHTITYHNLPVSLLTVDGLGLWLQAVLQGHFFTVVAGHMVIVLLALYLCPHPRRAAVLKKFATTTELKLGA